MKVYLDIETIPSQNKQIKQQIKESIKPPGSIKKPDSIQTWMNENKEQAFEEQYRKTALDGLYGHICSACIAINDDEPVVFFSEPRGECKLISDLFNFITDSLVKNDGKSSAQLAEWIGFNHINFDLKFIKHRSIILGVKPPSFFPVNVSPYSELVFDIMQQWAGYRDYISQDKLSLALFGAGKGEVDGSMVWPLYQAGEFEKIKEYNKRDVIQIRSLYKRMKFIAEY